VTAPEANVLQRQDRGDRSIAVFTVTIEYRPLRCAQTPPAMIHFLHALLLLAAAAPFATAASDKPLKPCTVISPTTERFFDLNPMRRLAPSETDGKKSSKKEGDEGSWHARGYDYGANFTINFCGPVVEELDEVQDLDKALWRNVSAFYEKGGKQWAIG
jgi:cation-dependent mannose-6-phosphate receptor